MHILPNISRSKGNQKVKFGQLIEYNMRNIFVQTSYAFCVGTSPKSLSEKFSLNISLDQYSKVQYILFWLYAKLRAIEVYWI